MCSVIIVCRSAGEGKHKKGSTPEIVENTKEQSQRTGNGQFQFSGDKINHGRKSFKGVVTSCLSFCRLYH